MAWGVLFTRFVLRSLWLTCVLLLVTSVAAWAQPSLPAEKAVDKALVTVRASDQKVAQLSSQKVQLLRRQQQQLVAVDRLKREKASWRKDRELNAALADANDTAKRLGVIDAQLRAANQQVANARQAAVIAIDVERATATGVRLAELNRLRVQLAPVAPAPKKIVLPNAEIDPLADPNELEQQVKEILAIEKQLDAQRRGLDQQSKDLLAVGNLRQAHDRAGELSTRDDDQPHRGAPRSGGRSDEASASPNDAVGTGGGNFGSDKSQSLESTAVVLGEVIDRSTIDSLNRASKSTDPKTRAEAAARAAKAVSDRLQKLKNQRLMIEQRARQLRGK